MSELVCARCEREIDPQQQGGYVEQVCLGRIRVPYHRSCCVMKERDALREQVKRLELVNATRGVMHEANLCTHYLEAQALRERLAVRLSSEALTAITGEHQRDHDEGGVPVKGCTGCAMIAHLEALESRLAAVREALSLYVEWYAGDEPFPHEKGCPGDDTCACPKIAEIDALLADPAGESK